MSEQDFRDALRRTMDAVTPPPQMSDEPVLAAAHRDRRRRRTLWASAGTAVVVAGIAVGVVLVAPSKSGGDDVQVGGPRPTSTDEAVRATGEGSANEETSAPADTEETLPPGMTDRTQRSGPHYERGAELATALDDVVTSGGFGAPGDLEAPGITGSLKRDQANYDGKVDGAEHWTYTATTPVTKGSGVGEMIVEVSTLSEEVSGCDLPGLWGLAGQCAEVTVNGKKVAVVDATDDGQEHVDQFAAYRHDDGTIVYVSQSADYGFSNLPPLAKLPFTPEQLAAFAVDNRFTVID